MTGGDQKPILPLILHRAFFVSFVYFVVDNQLVHRMEVRGRHANTDIMKTISPDLISQSDWPKPTRRLWAFGPGVLALAGLGWFIRRRAKIMSGRSQ